MCSYPGYVPKNLQIYDYLDVFLHVRFGLDGTIKIFH